jgi:hypothetical protein
MGSERAVANERWLAGERLAGHYCRDAEVG